MDCQMLDTCALLDLPVDIIRQIDDHLEPAYQLAFRLSCTSIHNTLPPCMIQSLPNDPNESSTIRSHKTRFLQLIENELVTTCTRCCRMHTVKNVLRHPGWRDPFPYDTCLWAGGIFSLCPCINITITDAWYIWNSFWGFYDLGTTDFTSSNSLTYRMSNSGEFIHHCRAFPEHPLFNKIEVDIRGYKNDVSTEGYHRMFGGRPNFQLCFDFEYRFQLMLPHGSVSPDTDPIKFCPHTSLITWDYRGNYEFRTEDWDCRQCKTSVRAIVESETFLVVKVTRAYGNSTDNLLPFEEGVESSHSLSSSSGGDMVFT